MIGKDYQLKSQKDDGRLKSGKMEVYQDSRDGLPGRN